MPSSAQLPSLDSVDNGSSVNGTVHVGDGQGHDHSTSLRGNYHSRVPDISNQPLNTLLPVLKDGRIHPEPYYITQNVVLKVPDGRPPWVDDAVAFSANNTQILVDMWEGNEKFRQQVLDELIKDCIHMEVAGIVSGTVAEHRAKNHHQAFLHAWLEDQVVTDTVYAATEDIVWEALWDQARKMKKRQMDELDREMGRRKHADAHMLAILRENYTQPLTSQTGSSLINKKWTELLYHTNRYMQRGSLMENYAIRKLQEQIISQIAAKTVLDESVKCVDQEMARFDEDERVDRPPKKITVTKQKDVGDNEHQA